MLRDAEASMRHMQNESKSCEAVQRGVTTQPHSAVMRMTRAHTYNVREHITPAHNTHTMPQNLGIKNATTTKTKTNKKITKKNKTNIK